MRARRIVVLGTGYVGLTAGACLAFLGHQVTCVDTDEAKINQLRRSVVRIHEPGLADLVRDAVAVGRLDFATESETALRAAEVVFLCLPTPMGVEGSADLSIVEDVLDELRTRLPAGCVLVTKSTVPIGTAERVTRLLNRPDVSVVANPEFLREGWAVHDFLNPERIVLGTGHLAAAELVADLYSDLDAATVITSPASAELVKYASNCFLAMKLSYVNAISELCERVGADVADVMDGMGRDHRIGQAFLRPGPGWGGSCLPKDAHALVWTAARVGMDFPLLQAAIDTNARQVDRMAEKVRSAVGGDLTGVRVGVLGLSFKAGTDDLRDSPALLVARRLITDGAEVAAYDPEVRTAVEGVPVADDPYDVAKEAAALVLLTDWPQFRGLDWSRMADLMATPVVVDTRNHLDPARLALVGFVWHGVGRPSHQAATDVSQSAQLEP